MPRGRAESVEGLGAAAGHAWEPKLDAGLTLGSGLSYLLTHLARKRPQ